jgi:flavin reductase (DIM6/NTAB) family NADH-FMN oxidoreductase RutF
VSIADVTTAVGSQVPLRDRLPSGVHEQKDLRHCFGAFATGVTVITAGGDNPGGMTANAFSSLSLEPAMVLVCVKHDAVLHDSILAEQGFAVSVLAAHQESVARHFANKSRPRGSVEFDNVRWSAAPTTGAPVVEGSLAWIDCRLVEVYDGGDHSIFIGSVLHLGRGEAKDALLFYGGGFHRLETGLAAAA